jgi:hypothetical protein
LLVVPESVQQLVEHIDDPLFEFNQGIFLDFLFQVYFGIIDANMQVVGTGNQTFLLVNGLSLNRRIRLYEGVAIEPANGTVEMAQVIDPFTRGLEHAIATIFLPIVRCQIEVKASNPKALAIKAWNAVWDAVLLSALFNCEAECNLQSNVPVDQISTGCNLRVTNYHLRGLSLSGPRVLSEQESKWVERYFPTAKNLLDDWRFQNAVHALSSFRWHAYPRTISSTQPRSRQW